MDYRIFIDPFTQRPRIKVESEHSAFGHYLSDEMVGDNTQLQQLIRRLHRNEEEWQHQGREWRLKVEDGAVSVSHNSQFAQEAVILPDELLNTDSSELCAECGREDFLHLLEAWLAYQLTQH